MTKSPPAQSLKTSDEGSASGATVTILLPGLNCLSCARNLEKKLRKIDRIEKAEVTPESESLLIAPLDAATLISVLKEVRNAGWEPRTSRVGIPVRDIPYASPTGSAIESELLGLAGVVAARFIPARRLTIVDFVPGVVGIDDLRRAVSRSGYETDHPTSESSLAATILAEGRSLRKSVIGAFSAALLSTILSLPLLLSAPPGVLRPAEWLLSIGELLRRLIPQLFTLNPIVLIAGLTALCLITAFACARDLFVAGWKAIAARNPDANSVALMALTALFIGSVAWTLASGKGGHPGDYAAWGFQSVLWSLAFFLLSRAIEESSRPAGAARSPDSTEKKSKMLQSVYVRSLRLVPAVLTLAIAAFVVWFDSGSHNRVLLAISAFVSILLVSSPSLIAMAVLDPLDEAARQLRASGVRFVSDRSFEEIGDLKLLVLDAPGVITSANPKVTDYVLLDGLELRELLRTAGSAAALSSSLIAGALVQKAQQAEKLSVASGFHEEPARGFAAEVDGQKLTIGSSRFVDGHHIDAARIQDELNEFQAQGKTTLVFAVDGVTRGAIAFQDDVRPEVRTAVDALKAMGIAVRMITADEPQTAESIGRGAGIEDVVSYRTPAEKKRSVTESRREAPTAVVVSSGGATDLLACAEMGISLNNADGRQYGTVAVGGTLSDLANAIERSRAATAKARRNLKWVLAYHVIAILLAAQVLYPIAGVIIDPPIAAAALAAAFLTMRGSLKRRTGLV